MNTYKFTNRYGTEYEIAFEATRYVYGGLAIEVHCREQEQGWWEPYGTLTKNLGYLTSTSRAYLDANNMPDLVEFVLEKGWCEKVGEERSGFCTYPLVEFTDEFINEVCIGKEW